MIENLLTTPLNNYWKTIENIRKEIRTMESRNLKLRYLLPVLVCKPFITRWELSEVDEKNYLFLSFLA